MPLTACLRLRPISAHLPPLAATFRIPLLRSASSKHQPIAIHRKPQTNLNSLLLKMPRNPQHLADAQQSRQRIKAMAARFTPGTCTLQILGSGAPGSPASLYLFTDHSRYLFNCGEGTQRLAHEHKTKLARLEHIFVTRASWQRIGGLPGLSLTVQDSGVMGLTLHGPPGLGDWFQAMRRFVVLKNLRVEEAQCELGQEYEDSVLSVKYVPLTRRSGSPAEQEDSQATPNTPLDDTDYFAHEDRNGSGSPSSEERSQTSPSSQPPNFGLPARERQVMAFVCQLKPRPGALNFAKCVDRGIPAGPLLGQLKNGNAITLPNGETVQPGEVRDPDDPGKAFAVIDIPGVEWLDALEQQAERFVDERGEAPALMVHFTSARVMEEPRYRRFMARFGRGTTQLRLNEENRFSGYVAAHRIQCQLNQISADVFPMLSETEAGPGAKRIKLDVGQEAAAKEEAENVQLEGASSLTQYHLRPAKGLDRSGEAMLVFDEYRAETAKIEGFTEALVRLRAAEREAGSQLEERRRREEEYPRIVFLGTGSCIPNKTRNVSSILVHTSPDACILLDCGEGTAAQMRRFYGAARYQQVLGQLRAIYVSHLHADHHIGLIGVLQERRAVVGAAAGPVMLLAPQQMASWLNFYDAQLEGLREEYELVANADLLATPLSDQRTAAMGISAIRTCLVRHCPHSFGVAIECTNSSATSSAPASQRQPFKLTYSGDTMPCDELVRLGTDSTVLIHEATMEDELVDQARAKMHSTVSQAIEQGRRMGAQHTLLTHFSQRYAKLPRLQPETVAAGLVFIAFDNMEVTVGDLGLLGRALPTMQLMFAEHCEEMEQKAQKRAFKAKRALEAGQEAS